jgi:hypothetical protein
MNTTNKIVMLLQVLELSRKYLEIAQGTRATYEAKVVPEGMEFCNELMLEEIRICEGFALKVIEAVLGETKKLGLDDDVSMEATQVLEEMIAEIKLKHDQPMSKGGEA